MHDGEEVLDILARHPATARFIATKLTRRLVGDDPPPALVDRVAARFSATDGDLREVVRTILTSPEFLAPDSYRAKTKTPFEFVVSAVRATGTSIVNAAPLVRQLQELGMPLYQCQPPTGYRDAADAWTNTGALVARMNFALALASGQLPGTQFAAEGSAGDRRRRPADPRPVGQHTTDDRAGHDRAAASGADARVAGVSKEMNSGSQVLGCLRCSCSSAARC